MSQKIQLKILTSVFLTIFLCAFFANEARADAADNVSGWAWSENIGWISFNNTSGGGATNYGINIDASNNLIDYAWSENIGWIKFNPNPDFVSGVYPTCPVSTCPGGSPNYPAKFDPVTKKITGWARACAGTVNGNCNSATRSDGWDGWILLGPINNGGTDYGAFLDDTVNPNQFRNWAWGGGVVGWISFNRINCDPDQDGLSEGLAGCPIAGTIISNYKVIVSFSSLLSLSDLTYSFANHCSQSRIPVLSWDTNAADPQYEIEILTTGITGSGSGKAWSPACNSCCNVFPYNNVAFGGGTYAWRVRVRDGFGPWSDWEQSTFTARLNCDPVASFNISTQTPGAGEEVNATSTSQVFGGAIISSCLWEITPPAPGGGTFVPPTTENFCNPKIKFSISATSLKLTATDSSGYSCYTTKSINVRLPLPDWIELPPVSLIGKLLVAIFNFLKF
ncbi:MAG: hypothetical protein ABIG40_01160 [Parcubacteria group bacterium]